MRMSEIILMLIIIWYFGNAIGALMQCSTIPKLKKVKNMVWFIPVFKVTFLCYLLFKAPKLIVPYMIRPNMNTVLLLCIEKSISDTTKTNQPYMKNEIKTRINKTGNELSRTLENLATV